MLTIQGNEQLRKYFLNQNCTFAKLHDMQDNKVANLEGNTPAELYSEVKAFCEPFNCKFKIECASSKTSHGNGINRIAYQPDGATATAEATPLQGYNGVYKKAREDVKKELELEHMKMELDELKTNSGKLAMVGTQILQNFMGRQQVAPGGVQGPGPATAEKSANSPYDQITPEQQEQVDRAVDVFLSYVNPSELEALARKIDGNEALLKIVKSFIYE